MESLTRACVVALRMVRHTANTSTSRWTASTSLPNYSGRSVYRRAPQIKRYSKLECLSSNCVCPVSPKTPTGACHSSRATEVFQSRGISLMISRVDMYVEPVCGPTSVDCYIHCGEISVMYEDCHLTEISLAPRVQEYPLERKRSSVRCSRKLPELSVRSANNTQTRPVGTVDT